MPEHLSEALRTKSGLDAEFRVVLADGTLHHLRANAGVGAGTILDDDALAPHLGKFLADDPHVDVGRSTGRVGHDDRDRVAGIILGVRGSDTGDERHGCGTKG